MTTRHKDFSTGARQQDPVTFNVDEETFTAKPAIPGAMLLDFVAKADSGDGGEAAGAIMSFLEGVIIDDDKQRFRDLLHDPDRAVQIETLGEIVEWLVEQYTQRPTEQPKLSQPGLSTVGTGSTATVSATG